MKLRTLFALLLVMMFLPVGLLAQKTAGAKSGPARDPKTGRFIKKTAEPGKTTTKKKKKLPPRDPKTGRFIKASGAPTGGAKKGPARDPKTGRFIKKS